MKKNIIILFLLIFILNCIEFKLPRKYQTPDIVFQNWLSHAKKREYDKMFQYEYFKFENVEYCYNKLYSPKTWTSAAPKEQKKFIELYKQTLKNLLDNMPDEKYEPLLRLKKSYNLHITQYIIDMTTDTGWLNIAGDYPGEERIRLIKINDKWYLINPFGYHSYVPTFKTLKAELKK